MGDRADTTKDELAYAADQRHLIARIEAQQVVDPNITRGEQSRDSYLGYCDGPAFDIV